jgi:hypothetical protein
MLRRLPDVKGVAVVGLVASVFLVQRHVVHREEAGINPARRSTRGMRAGALD